MTTPQPTTVDAYIAGFPAAVQERLQQIRATKHHIGFYPTPGGIEAFEAALSKYKGAKGPVQFPLDQPLPLDLIRSIVAFRVQEHAAKPGKKKPVQ